LPYAAVLILLGTKHVKVGMALGVSSATAAALSILLFGMPSYRFDPTDHLLDLGMLLAQGVLAATAALRTSRQWRGVLDNLKLAAIIVGSLAYFGCVVGFVGYYLPGDFVAPVEAAAPGELRSINTAEFTYAEKYKTGYSPTLARVGPPSTGNPTPGAAGLIDSALASGEKAGYRITYRAEPRDATGKIIHYTIVARSPKYRGKYVLPSFFTDDTGVLRETTEDRDATASDPPIGG
jgi:hypothetical protein